MNSIDWPSIVADHYQLPKAPPLDILTKGLLHNLGAVDPLTRQDYGYVILAHWIGAGYYSRGRLKQLSEKLMAQLPQRSFEPDSVFLRSYSALALALIVAYDHQTQTLTAGDILPILRAAINYCADERDLRGHVPNKGWAHSAAHTADLLFSLALSRHMDANYLTQILYAIARKVQYPTGYIFIHEEEERLARAALAALRHAEITPTIIEAWVAYLGKVLEADPPKKNFDEAAHSAYLNTKHFLQSLYLQLMLDSTAIPQGDFLKSALFELFMAFPH
jgi:hypothetical protein